MVALGAQLIGATADSDQIQLRAERNPKANGRVYRIAFTASDGNGASCAGVARVVASR